MDHGRVHGWAVLAAVALFGCLGAESGHEIGAARQTEPGWIGVVLPWPVATSLLIGGPLPSAQFDPHDGSAIGGDRVPVVLKVAVQRRLRDGSFTANDRIELFNELIRGTGAVLPQPVGPNPCAPPGVDVGVDPLFHRWDCPEGQQRLQDQGDVLLRNHLRLAGYTEEVIEAAILAARQP